MSIDKQMVEKVARLSRIDLPASRQEIIAHELSHIINWIEHLSEVDTDGVEPMTSAVVNQNTTLRKDEIVIMNEKEAVLVNAPESIQDFYTVPKVIE